MLMGKRKQIFLIIGIQMQKKYEFLNTASIPRGFGGIICMCTEPVPINEKDAFIPCNLI